MNSVDVPRLYLYPGRRSELNADGDSAGPYYSTLLESQTSPRRQPTAASSPTTKRAKSIRSTVNEEVPIKTTDELLRSAAEAVKAERQLIADSARRREASLTQQQSEWREAFRKHEVEKIQSASDAALHHVAEERRLDVEHDQNALFLAHRHAQEQKEKEDARLERLAAPLPNAEPQRLDKQTFQSLAFHEDEARADVAHAENLAREAFMHVLSPVPLTVTNETHSVGVTKPNTSALLDVPDKKDLDRSMLSLQLRSSTRKDGSPRNDMDKSVNPLEMWFEGDDDDDRGPVESFYRREIEKEEAAGRRDLTMAFAKSLMRARNQKRLSTVANAVMMATSMKSGPVADKKDEPKATEEAPVDPWEEL